MAKLGSFGAAARESDPDAERDTFDFFGTKFVVHEAIPAMLAIQLGAGMTGKVGEIELQAAVWEALRISLTAPATADGRPDRSQFDQFRRLAVQHRCDSDELIRLVYSMLGIQIAFPTEQQPTSPDGPLQTGEKLNSSASGTPDSPTLVSVDEASPG